MERSPSCQLAPVSFSFQGRREEERPGPSERGRMAFPALLKDEAEQGFLPPPPPKSKPSVTSQRVCTHTPGCVQGSDDGCLSCPHARAPLITPLFPEGKSSWFGVFAAGDASLNVPGLVFVCKISSVFLDT